MITQYGGYMTKTLRYTETFYSIQGEGIFMGTPSVFLRTFGCNFRCKNFSTDHKQQFPGANPEVEQIIKTIDNYSSYEDLPLVSTGCDSYSSTYPEFKRFAKNASPGELAEILSNLIPDKRWGPDCHLVITGGEPLLGWQEFYPKLLKEKQLNDITNITFETNGTQILRYSFLKYIINNLEDKLVTFSVSPKLSCSGEKAEQSIKPDIIAQYQTAGQVYLKFVVGTEDDVHEALEYIKLYRDGGFYGSVYLMGVGGTDNQFYKSNKQIAELALKHGLRYSDRMHIQLFGNRWNT